MNPEWNEVLADARARLQAARAWLDGEGPAPEPFVAPGPLGALPAALGDEARAILDEHRVLEAALERRRSELRERRSAVGEALARPRRRPAPCYLDAPV